jgi:hypothetical protein
MKVLLHPRFQVPFDDRLRYAVRDRWDSQRELHINTVSPWAGLRSSILSTHFAGKASRY